MSENTLHSFLIGTNSVEISVATAQGLRSYQEDRYFSSRFMEGLCFGVFDGHGGAGCSDFCENNVVKLLEEIEKEEAPFSATSVLESLIAKLNQRTYRLETGSTASIVLLPRTLDSVCVAILGDSPVIVKRVDGTVWTAPEHNVRSNQAERSAAEARGGYVHGGYLFAHSDRGLQMSRALGDRGLSSVLSREPEIFTHKVGSGSFILAATDGIGDPSHCGNETSSNLMSMVEETTAQDIVDAAVKARTGDNATAILVRIK
jgi:serine/threonine protein phosphatase PrpC